MNPPKTLYQLSMEEIERRHAQACAPVPRPQFGVTVEPGLTGFDLQARLLEQAAEEQSFRRQQMNDQFVRRNPG